MSVEIDPVELGFRRPFTVEVGQILKIKNPNSAPVAFKVKTTAPKQYCVRPNSGRIEPGHDVEVSVLLQAMKQEPPLDQRCKDKFLVQSVAITGDNEFTNAAQIWDSVDKASVKEKKIRVNWLAAAENGGQPEQAAVTPAKQSAATNGVEATPEAPPPAYSSPHDETIAVTPAQTSSHHDSEPESRDQPAQASSLPAAAVETVKSTAEATYEELKQQLAKAEAVIASFKNEASSGLRQRKGGASGADEKAAPTSDLAQAVRQGTEGVPVQIVAALCLVSFLLAYFFF